MSCGETAHSIFERFRRGLQRSLSFVELVDGDATHAMKVTSLQAQPFLMHVTLEFPEDEVSVLEPRLLRPYVHDCRRFDHQTCEAGKMFKSNFIALENLWLLSTFDALKSLTGFDSDWLKEEDDVLR